MIKGIKSVRELIHEDNTSLLFHSVIEKSIIKATSEEKITAARELDITTQRDYKNTPPEITMKEKSKKENSKSHMQKRKNKSIVIRSHIEENFRHKLKW